MVRLTGTISRLGRCKVFVIGDFVLDTYTVGKVRRISPEAPVAVVNVQKQDHRPGGAGNVVLNLVSMGCQVSAVGRVGDDSAGTCLVETLSKENVEITGLMRQPHYPTPVKNRIIAENQQIVRVDHEEILPLNEMLEQQLIAQLPKLMEGVHVIAISDYGKGLLSTTLLTAVIEQGRVRGIPIIADPKGIDFSKYARSTVIKPNLSEAYGAAGLGNEASLDQVAAKVLHLSHCDTLMVTRSEAGISLFHKDGTQQDFPVKVREVKDVTGAGDTVLAMMACALGNGLTLAEAAQLSNIAAGIAIERFGCARISLSELARRLLDFDVNNKVFDEEHLYALQEALREKKFAILSLSGEQGLTTPIFTAIRNLSQSPEKDLVVYIKDSCPCPEFVNLLASLHDVDFILVKEDSLTGLCERVTPDEIYDIKEGKLHKILKLDLLLGSSC